MINRLARVCEVLKRELGVIIPREIDIRDALITVASVDITPDLKQAHVYISALGNAQARRIILARQGLCPPPARADRGSGLLALIEQLGFVQVDSIMAGILTIGLLGLISDLLIRMIHKRLFKYLNE